MLVRPNDIFTLVKLVHHIKAHSPILVTLDGIFTLVKL